MSNFIIDMLNKYLGIFTKFFSEWWWAVLIGIGLLVMFIAYRIFLRGAGL